MMFQIFEIAKKYSLQNKKVVGISEDKITSMNVFPLPNPTQTHLFRNEINTIH